MNWTSTDGEAIKDIEEAFKVIIAEKAKYEDEIIKKLTGLRDTKNVSKEDIEKLASILLPGYYVRIHGDFLYIVPTFDTYRILGGKG